MVPQLNVDEDPSSKIYEVINEIVYPIFLTITLIFHSVLLVFIIFFSPSHLNFLKFLLLTTSLLDVFATSILFYIQPRILSEYQVNVPVYCYGPCREMNTQFCFSLFMMWQTVSIAVGISLTYTLYFKYHKLNSKGPLFGWKLVRSLFLFYIPCLVSMCCAFVVVLRNVLPNEELNKESFSDTRIEFTKIGNMKLGELPNRINFAMIAYAIYCSPIITFWFHWKTNKSLNNALSGSSPYLRYHAKNVMMGITIQVVMHFIFYIPFFTLYSYSLLTGTKIFVQQFFMAMSPNLAASFDPLINLYFVVPYRTKIKSWFGKKHQQTSTIRIASLTPSGYF